MNFKPKWRIVRDHYHGYEVQCKRWWFPLWIQYGINSSRTLEQAEERAGIFANKFVKDKFVKDLGHL